MGSPSWFLSHRFWSKLGAGKGKVNTDGSIAYRSGQISAALVATNAPDDGQDTVWHGLLRSRCLPHDNDNGRWPGSGDKAPELVPTFFSRADFSALLGSIPDRDFRELVICALSAGMRQGELLALRWPNVDLERWVITVANSSGFTTKNRRVRVIPMTKAVWQMLRERRERNSGVPDLVFHSEEGSIPADGLSKAFKAAVRTAELPNTSRWWSNTPSPTILWKLRVEWGFSRLSPAVRLVPLPLAVGRPIFPARSFTSRGSSYQEIPASLFSLFDRTRQDVVVPANWRDASMDSLSARRAFWKGDPL